MKCPRCGSPNKESAVGCNKCGFYFELKNEKRKMTANAFWNRETTDDGLSAEDSVQTSGRGLLILEDEENGAFQNSWPHEALYRKSNAEKLKDLPNQTEAQVVIPKVKAKPRYTVRKGKFALSIIFGILLLLSVCFGLVKLIFWIVNNQQQKALLEALANQPATPLIEQMIKDGKSYHRITFYGDDGERVMVHSPQVVLPFENGRAEMMLDDEDYIPESTDPENPLISVQLEATLFREDGTEVSIPVPAFTIDIPLAPITLISPLETELTSYETSINITVKVNPESHISIGSKNVTENLSSRGVVTQSVSLSDSGLNYIDIIVECQGYRRNTISLIVNRPQMEVPINLMGNVKTSTYDRVILLEGQTIPGATLSTTAKLATEKEDLTVDPLNGTFSFNVVLNRYGENVIEITSMLTDGTSSTLVYRVIREADLEGYTKSAWVMDYSQMLLDAANTSGPSHVYLCYATLLESFETDDGSLLYRFDASAAQDMTQILIVEYTGSKTLTVGMRYRIYADVIGLHDDDPLIVARFIYVYLPADSTQRPSASPSPGTP
ncbi:MAG: zinc ribbon domain-containing protein [Christensenellales bacterium]|jgi:hypothetical protein